MGSEMCIRDRAERLLLQQHVELQQLLQFNMLLEEQTLSQAK